MELITTSSQLENTFCSLLERYNEFYWLSAWASSSSVVFKKLITQKHKIKKVLIGIHFYQTDPKFIEEFIEEKNVKYILQPQGTFHPKVYLFYNSEKSWKVIIGSANFTQAAFSKNTEICSLLSSEDKDSKVFLDQLFKTIDYLWNTSQYFTLDELNSYKKVWANSKIKINSLSGTYGKKEKRKSSKVKPIYLVPITQMEWEQFIEKVTNETSLTTRLKVLSIARSLFHRVDSFQHLNDHERKFIAGLPNKLPTDTDVDWGYFGSMKANGQYHQKIGHNNLHISNAIDEIPLVGQITKSHYLSFLTHYQKAFTGNFLGTATRLLAMKRPDTFICLDSKNRSALCKDFNIIQTGLNYDRYWNEIIERIYDSQWWLNPRPKNKIERQVSEARAAFLDSIYYR